jgi:hypothetical protein
MDCTNYDDLLRAIEVIGWKPSVVLSGAARGVDRMGERWARENGPPVDKYPADWNKYGRSAGYKRNNEMAKNADALLALWDFKSKGTRHMINLAKKAGLTIYVYKVS